MSLIFRKRVKLGHGQWATVSRSGVSLSKRVGRVTFNTRRGFSIRIGHGFTWRP